MRVLIISLALLSGCTVSLAHDKSVDEKLATHAAVINGIASYIEELQNKKILPKPGEK